jgi:hypothetical protein
VCLRHGGSDMHACVDCQNYTGESQHCRAPAAAEVASMVMGGAENYEVSALAMRLHSDLCARPAHWFVAKDATKNAA